MAQVSLQETYALLLMFLWNSYGHPPIFELS